MRRAFVVFEQDCWTMPDLIDVLSLISDEDEAAEFMDAYEAVCGDDTAVHNLRYMLRLMDTDESSRLSELFMIELPGPGETLSPRQTFGMSSLGISDTSVPDYAELEAGMKFDGGSWAKSKSGHFNSGVQDSPKRGAKKAARKPLKRTMLEGRPE